jgi:hypothetical protein
MKLRSCDVTTIIAALLLVASWSGLSTISAVALDQAQQGEAKPTTIVGCLVRGLPDGKGADADDFFVRTPSVQVPPGTTVAVGTPGSASTATSGGKPAGDSFYRITGLGADQLQPHIGHRVEMQGRLTDNLPAKQSPRASTAVDSAGRATTTVETRIEVAGVLQATAVKMVSATCNQ